MNRLQIIDKVVAYYGQDLNRRAVQADTCCYKTSDGRKCAVGMFMRPEALELLKGENNDDPYSLQAKCDSGKITQFEDFDEMLVKEARGYSVQFWQNLQGLHDGAENWDYVNHKGLTPRGEAVVNELKHRYGER